MTSDGKAWARIVASLRQDLSAQQIAVLFLTSTFGFFAHLEGDELRAALDSLVGVVGKGIRA